MLAYVKENLRHVGSGSVDWLRCHSIRIFSRHWRERAVVPRIASQFISGLREDSITAQVLARNDTAVEDADSVLHGRMRILNRTIDFGHVPAEWHRDPFSGCRFPLVPYPRIDGTSGAGGDIVPLWELSRLQFAPCLIEAYRRTRDERYARHFYGVLSQWDAANPYLMGANWACGLDIAIRALQIAFGYCWLPNEDGRWVERLLWLHLLFLQERDLFERRATINNHYLVALALQYTLLHFFEGDLIEKWKGAVLSELNAEVLHQFRPDGGNIESAMQYHQFSLEALLLMTSVLGSTRQAGSDGIVAPGMSDEANDRIYAATHFVARCCSAWGGSPRIGDSSDARVLIQRRYFDWHPTDASYLADWSRLLYGVRDPFADDRWQGALTFPESGVALWRTERYALIALAMPVVPEAGGHNHYDKGSFLLRTTEGEVFIDSGTYCYTHAPEERRSFREGRAHNIVLIDGMEQAVGPGGGVFDVPEFGWIELDASQEGPELFKISMVHDGYCGRTGLGLLKRYIVCMPAEIVLQDSFEGSGQHDVEIGFNLASGLVLDSDENRVRIRFGNGGLCEVVPPNGFVAAVESGRYSEAYMKETPIMRIVLRGRSEPRSTILTRIRIVER
jgi:hypothetical protein